LISAYNRWPDKAGLSRRHFGRAVDTSIFIALPLFTASIMALFVSNIFIQCAPVLFDNAVQVLTKSETASLADFMARLVFFGINRS